MDDDAGMRKLLEIIFRKKVTILQEMVAQNSSDPTCLLTEDFSERMNYVLSLRKEIVSSRWKGFFDIDSRKIMSSLPIFLTYVMAACIHEHECDRNVFDSFISVCVFLMNLRDEILEKTGVNFGDLNPDIIIVFYRNVLKEEFQDRGGLPEFVKYILGHKYLGWIRTSVIGSSASLHDMLEKELREYRDQLVISSSADEKKANGLALKVLSETSVELPSLPSEPVLIMRLVAYRKKKMATEAEMQRRIQATVKFQTLNATSQGCSSMNSDSKTNYATNHREHIGQYEDIIEAVIKYNHSKNSVPENMKNRIQKEAGGILENLKKNIKSLIEVIDESGEE